MKLAILLFSMACSDAFVIAPPTQVNRELIVLRQATSKDDHPVLNRMMRALESLAHDVVVEESAASIPSAARLYRDLELAQKQWKDEADRLHNLEHALVTDPDLAGCVKPPKRAQKMYIEKEAHKHDSLHAEIQHALETDPDLVNIVGRDKKINNQFMEKEAHVHDSLFDEIEHSLDNDPYLSM